MNQEQALLRAAALDIVIPANTDQELSDVLGNEPTADDEPLGVPKRELLFVDERVRVVVTLSVPECDEELLNRCLSRAEIRVEAWAFDRSQERGPGSVEQVRDLIHTATIPTTNDPLVLVRQADDDSPGNLLVLVWETQLSLTRPRVRMVDPSIAFYSAMVVSAEDQASPEEMELLRPFRPLEPSVLGPMRQMPGYSDASPYLAASRLEKVVPEQIKAKQQFHIEHMSPRYKIVPAAIARMQYSRVNEANSMPKIIASLNVEIIPFIEIQATILTLDVTIANGSIEDLTPNLLPLDCRSKDLITFLYRLNQTSNISATSSPSPASQLPNFDVLNINLQFNVRVTDVCQSRINMAFTTNVDFFQALNPSYGAPSQPIQRPHRPASLPLTVGGSQSQQSLSTSLQQAQPIVDLSTFMGVTISFTAPVEPVRVGQAFTWRVLVNNRSSRPAKVAIYPMPRMPRGSPHTSSGKRHAPRHSVASYHSSDKRPPREGEAHADIAQAVVDENVIYAMQHSHALPKQTELIALTAEVRVGALGSGQCHEGEIELLALRSGTLKLDAIRVIDLLREAEEGLGAAGVMIDIKNLPDVIVAESQ
ncbi:uncharacterized protein HMPREF1541_08878 [Cyphellophora europaea CBS 101466]|uniref:Trafficking protein particle complex II-specific subunit 65 IgD3 domain-containing protein n=1 Tax=Cyphellophora europaea (strain CBS 101466) TaxID=1220924 RepID=W2RJS8_CYPE1|nr:uncharacterized protein HMPREF1541_08878 [Cyphellophora europaea CBS 101466]ETN36600.1 hypothetical protein HMPREF1541_08878 [Cyphellophora europaea CBS 101466]